MKMVMVLSLMAALLTASTVDATYNPATALSALYYSKIAYCPSADIASWDCPPCKQYHSGITSQKVFEGDYSSQSYTAYNGATNQIIVAFRGSSNIGNWIADLSFKKIPYPACSGCEVHEGFYEVWQGLRTPMMASINSLISTYPTASIFVTGHSLGAAVSIHAGVDIASNLRKPVTVYNFGEPRVGNQAFAQWATTVLSSGEQYRVTHKADPVPHLPPMSWGYLHTPHELWYDNNGDSSYQNCTDSASAEDSKCSDSTIPIAISDHLLYLGICTECTCTGFEERLQAMPPLLMPKDYVRAPEEVRLM